MNANISWKGKSLIETSISKWKIKYKKPIYVVTVVKTILIKIHINLNNVLRQVIPLTNNPYKKRISVAITSG